VRFIGYSLVFLGFIVIVGTVGASDFYEACRRAADCVAGPAPSVGDELFKIMIGWLIIAGGCIIARSKD
jgi:hypothetical protein